jgi:hypothetical protein
MRTLQESILDLGADGVSTQIADQVEAPTHNGVVSIDSENYKIADTVVVTLIDQDLNKNTLVDEDLVMANTTSGHIIPALQIGNPLMTNAIDSSVVTNSSYSNIAWYDATVAIGGGKLATNSQNITINTGYSGVDIQAMDTANTYFNWDFSAFNATKTVRQVCLVNGTVSGTGSGGMSDVVCGAVYENKGIKKIPAPGGQSGVMSVNVTLTADSLIPTRAFVADVFSFGAGANNAIYRLLLEETGDNTATFEGTVEYTMLNQLNINTDATYTTLDSISSSVNIIVEQDMTDELVSGYIPLALSTSEGAGSVWILVHLPGAHLFTQVLGNKTPYGCYGPATLFYACAAAKLDCEKA